jgi:hypothetical protein
MPGPVAACGREECIGPPVPLGHLEDALRVRLPLGPCPRSPARRLRRGRPIRRAGPSFGSGDPGNQRAVYTSAVDGHGPAADRPPVLRWGRRPPPGRGSVVTPEGAQDAPLPTPADGWATPGLSRSVRPWRLSAPRSRPVGVRTPESAVQVAPGRRVSREPGRCRRCCRSPSDRRCHRHANPSGWRGGRSQVSLERALVAVGTSARPYGPAVMRT